MVEMAGEVPGLDIVNMAGEVPGLDIVKVAGLGEVPGVDNDDNHDG